jgi:hypothetical protein
MTYVAMLQVLLMSFVIVVAIVQKYAASWLFLLFQKVLMTFSYLSLVLPNLNHALFVPEIVITNAVE